MHVLGVLGYVFWGVLPGGGGLGAIVQEKGASAARENFTFPAVQ